MKAFLCFAACFFLSIACLANTHVVCDYMLPGDMNGDCIVNIEDMAIVASNWLVDCRQEPLNPSCRPKPEELRQKQQFHYIEMTLEAFRQDFGEYPPSSQDRINYSEVLGPDPNEYDGANILTEAMFGLDLLGIHPDSAIRSDGLVWKGGSNICSLYLTDNYNPANPANSVPYCGGTLANRKGPYIPLDYLSIFRLTDIYPDVGPFNGSNPVLCDVFEKTRHSGKKTGMPILYYRADPRGWNQDHSDGIENDVYHYNDNLSILQLGTVGNEVSIHPLADGIDDWQDFENMILNPKITAVKMPYRAQSFILISAGPDGLYGTEDDLFNFTE